MKIKTIIGCFNIAVSCDYFPASCIVHNTYNIINVFYNSYAIVAIITDYRL